MPDTNPRTCPECGQQIHESQERTITFRLRVTPEERERIRQMATAAGVTDSQLVRSRLFPAKRG